MWRTFRVNVQVNLTSTTPKVPDDLTLEEKQKFLASMTDVSVSSDAFFPFRDRFGSESWTRSCCVCVRNFQLDVVSVLCNTSALTQATRMCSALARSRFSIDHCSKYGVKYIAQPGGSVQDENVIAACDEYGMAMAFTNVRLFHH